LAVSELGSVLVGLVGAGIQASRSPALHMREGAAQGLAYVYRLIDIEALGLSTEELPELITPARRFGFAGLNITHPCKQSVIPLLDELSEDARESALSILWCSRRMDKPSGITPIGRVSPKASAVSSLTHPESVSYSSARAAPELRWPTRY
jgi:hypothetical protein